jgi:sugar phosphate isomerase/epimerase
VAFRFSSDPGTSIVGQALTRRGWLAQTASAGAGLAAVTARDAEGVGLAPRKPDGAIGYCLNTSTLMGQKLTVTEEVTIAAEVGYDAIEPWIRELDDHVKAGGSLEKLGREIRDRDLTVESAIGFFEWAVDDEARRQKAIDEAKRNMEMVRALGGKRLAAPPVGLTSSTGVDLLRVAERYRALLELGDTFGVVPEVELWGGSRTLHTLGEVALVAIESGHPRACILPDLYHLYKGGSSIQGLALLDGAAIHVFHMNDYPADPPRTTISDADRVYPGDGIAPLAELVRILRAIGFHGYFSLELFNRNYWRQDARTVARTGLEKMRAIVGSSTSNEKRAS